MSPIRIFIADDHTLVRQGVRRLLESQSDMTVVGEAANGKSAMSGVAEQDPDVALLDIGMPGLNGLEATQRIKAAQPQVAVLLLTVHDDADYLFTALRAGASGYILKEAEEVELLQAIRAVAKGEVYLYPSVAKKLVQGYLSQAASGSQPEAAACAGLTERQREILTLIAQGKSNREIAEQLVVSPYTVQTHRANLMHKLGLHTQADLVKYAVRHGLAS